MIDKIRWPRSRNIEKGHRIFYSGSEEDLYMVLELRNVGQSLTNSIQSITCSSTIKLCQYEYYTNI